MKCRFLTLTRPSGSPGNSLYQQQNLTPVLNPLGSTNTPSNSMFLSNNTEMIQIVVWFSRSLTGGFVSLSSASL